MSRTTPNINRFWADLIIEELARCGVRHFFIAPGSRSSPLVAAVAQSPEATATLHFDERGAAFAALGYGRSTGHPAAWITTSGTAAANGLPAFVEAAQSFVPLIALTADRPPELRDTGANQAIDQVRIFGTNARWFFDMPCPSDAIDPAFVLTTVDQAVHRAVDDSGPVHLNCPYREPLAPSEDRVKLPEPPRRWIGQTFPYAAYHGGTLEPDARVLSSLVERASQTQKGLLVVGELPSVGIAEQVASLAADLGWPVIADVTSQLRLGDTDAPLVPSPHFTCASMAQKTDPQLILRLGGAISSKEIQRYVDNAGAHIVTVAAHPERKDPSHRVGAIIRASINAFCRALGGVSTPADRTWQNLWIETGRSISAQVQGELDALETVSEPGAAATLTRLLPHSHALFVASSMPIRDVDMFGAASGRLRRVAANRGASGIDGTVATASGFQLGSQTPLTLVIGDLALLHDVNSLALVSGHPIVIVVLNNHGGGIFNFLPIADFENVFEPWFTAPHTWTFEHAAMLFNIPYERPTTAAGFTSCYSRLAASGGPALIEVVTDRRENRSLHDRLRTLALQAARNANG